MATSTLSAKDLALACSTDARTVRKFLRSHLPKDDQPGQGGRYAFTKGEVTKFAKAFAAWAAPKPEAAEKPAKKSKAPEAIEDISGEDEIIDLDDEVDDDLEDLSDDEDLKGPDAE